MLGTCTILDFSTRASAESSCLDCLASARHSSSSCESKHCELEGPLSTQKSYWNMWNLAKLEQFQQTGKHLGEYLWISDVKPLVWDHIIRSNAELCLLQCIVFFLTFPEVLEGDGQDGLVFVFWRKEWGLVLHFERHIHVSSNMGMEQQYMVIADRWWHSDTKTISYKISIVMMILLIR